MEALGWWGMRGHGAQGSCTSLAPLWNGGAGCRAQVSFTPVLWLGLGRRKAELGRALLAAQFLTGCGPARVHGPGVGDPCYKAKDNLPSSSAPPPHHTNLLAQNVNKAEIKRVWSKVKSTSSHIRLTPKGHGPELADQALGLI